MCNWDPSQDLWEESLKVVVTGRASGAFGLLKLCVQMLTEESPDPVLTGLMFAQTIKGIQDSGVIACAKHFIGNEQEHFRQAPEAKGYGYNISGSLSSNIDDQTMHELYLW